MDNSFEVLLNKKYAYLDSNLLNILKTNFSEEPSIKDIIGESAGTYCLFDYEKGISEKKFLDFKRYYQDVIFTKKAANATIEVYSSGMIRYDLKDEYNKILEYDFKFQKFPFDRHTIILAEFTLIENFI